MRKILQNLPLYFSLLLTLANSHANAGAATKMSKNASGDPCASPVLHVNAAAAANGDGTSWATAYRTLKDAIDVASLCPAVIEIRVAAGTYYPTGNRTHTDRDAAFLITRSNLKILGGYDATTGARDIKTNPTIVSGDIGVAGDQSDNSYHVMLLANIPGTDSLLIEGLTIRDGNASGSGYTYGKFADRNTGGGVSTYWAGSNLVFRYCTFNNNSAGGGGAMHFVGASPVIRNCIFSGNTAGVGGGIRNHDSSNPNISNCLFSGNTAEYGGAIENNLNSKPTILNCTITGNVANRYGGGMYSGTAYTEPVILNTIIYGNIGTLGDNGIVRANYNGAIPVGIGYSLVEGITTEDDWGNMSYTGSSDDLFTNAPGGDYTVKISSPTINRGKSSIVPAELSTDLAGNPRKQGVIDIGAYEVPVCFVGSVIHVDGAVNESGSGYGWYNAYKTLGEAIDLAHLCPDVTEIRVAASTYYPPGSSNVVAPEKAYTITRSNLKISGGYNPSTGTRDVNANTTTLSGELSLENSYHVMVLAAIPPTDSLIIDGFTITGGNATLADYTQINGEYIFHDQGAGIHISNAGPNVEIRNCTISNNSSDYGGGGVLNSFSGASFTNCTFTGNHSEGPGGGLYNANASNVINHSLFQENSSAHLGGGLFNESTNTLITATTFNGNTAVRDGGGMSNSYGRPVMTDCVFINNAAANGGGLYNGPSSMTVMTNTSFRGNKASLNGGGIANFDGWVRMISSIASGNTAQGQGGGIHNRAAHISLTNATLSGNTAATFGALYHSEGTFSMTNSLIYGNSSGMSVINPPGAITYSVVQGLSSTADGNLPGTTDPGFVNAPSFATAPFTGGDYRLQVCSPVTNAGNPDTTGLSLPIVDLSGQQRYFTDRVDLGAFENVYVKPGPGLAENNATDVRNQTTNGTTTYYDACNGILASVTTSGGSLDIRGATTARVWIETTQPARHVKRHFEITPLNFAGVVRGFVTLYFTQHEFDDFNALNSKKLPSHPSDSLGIANLLVEKRSGTSNDGSGLYNSYTAAAQTINPEDNDIHWNSSANRWEIGFAVTGFSGFFVKTSDEPLPVRWIAFNARTDEEGKALVHWKTDEKDVSYYEIERSINGKYFDTVARIEGNRDGVHEYRYTDPQPLSGTTYYRIRQTDLDGTFSYSRIVSLFASEIPVIKAYPIPARNLVIVQLGQQYVGTTISLINSAGIPVARQVAANTSLTIDLGRLDSGIYILSTVDGRRIRLVKE